MRTTMGNTPTNLGAAEPAASSDDEAGQTTAEYALVLLAAATIGTLLISWAGRTGRVAAVLDRVWDSVLGQIG